MPSTAQRRRHEGWLLELTMLPTAAGREERVIEWVRRWVKARKNLRLRRDASGNLLITQTRRSAGKPLLITAHLDHPAFVVRRMLDDRTVELEFRGGVHDPYFTGAKIEIFDDADRKHPAIITKLDAKARPFKRVRARLSRSTRLSSGCVGRWRLAGRLPRITRGLLHTHACDDLAAVAAALATLDLVRSREGLGHVGVLLTLAEEVGFIGAIAACRNRTVSSSARLICLENSRSFPDSPIGAGPVVRVGDRISVFAPSLTNRISQIVMDHHRRHPDFRWQRKLMAGGACEATTFSAYGFESTCLCLPLGNYHNMVDIDGALDGKRPARVGPEVISIDDFRGLIDMLVLCARKLDEPKAGSIRDRMEGLFAKHGNVLDG